MDVLILVEKSQFIFFEEKRNVADVKED